MQRQEFCKNCKCAKVTLSIPGSSDKVLISNTPSVIVESRGVETFTHQMNAPIEKTFEGNITKVELVEGFWHINAPNPTNRARCPLPGIYPLVELVSKYQADVDAGTVTDLYWRNNQLFCYFDVPDAYFNNVGTCTYKVFTGTDISYKFSDLRGSLYEHKGDKEIIYRVDCDDCCKDTEIMCDHHKFPGYKCYPIPPINRKLESNRYDLSRIYK